MTHIVLQICAAIAAAAVFSATFATAQSLSPCDDWRSDVLGIAEPWEANTRTYADGALRLMILTPPTDANPDGRQCQVLSLDADVGFAGLSFDGVTDSTDPTGLTVFIPARRWMPATDTYTDATLSVTRIPAHGAIAASLEP